MEEGYGFAWFELGMIKEPGFVEGLNLKLTSNPS